ncbi:AraC family transcriptional regulator [Streptomyces sp. NPDC048606]|uniref:AraC family transcriptional regulator n=1 Tax=Streptomyces sp. NPDC048606 TaxID=3154726 RepID=UPI0034386CBF
MATSHIKPHLRCLTSSAGDLEHAVVERAVERAAGLADTTPPPIGPRSHVVAVLSGRSADLKWNADGHARRARFHAGDTLVNPAGWASRPRWQDDVELKLLALDPVWMEKHAAESGAPGVFELAPSFQFSDPLLVLLVERLLAEYENPSGADPLYAQSLVQAASAIVVRRCARGGTPPDPTGGLSLRRLSEVRDYIHANLARRLTLDEIAAVAGVSTSHLNRLFRASTGESPYQYVLRQRVEHARRALLDTDDSITDIALYCGFADQSHLTRAVRRATGLTPRTLRAATAR